MSSGLGPAFGGIGVVTQMVVDALEPDVDLTVWRHHLRWPRPLRLAYLFARAFWGGLRRPDFILYEHIDLAQIHAKVPGLRGIRYGLFFYGTEAWRQLDEPRKVAILGADLKMTISATTLELARKSNPWLPDARVVWLGVRTGTPAGPEVPREPIALIVGRMNASERLKGHDPILDAWPKIRLAVPQARLIIVGGGDDRPRLQQRVEKEGISGVEFRGWISNSERDSLYRSSRLFLFPSRQEGFGLVAVEAAVAGLPVLGLRGTVIEELFPQGSGVVLVDEATGPQIAAAAIPLLSDPDLAGTIGRSARARVNGMFLEEHFVTRFREALAPLLD
ncbi:glycosyltransferase family 4 protein [Singulisphaera sp. GP187]|uniref:glycosyltransferase family 4 protein n=1 Tax=Singulisphaera sp. GP187 TaxID=1882752 RepID=UPI0009411F76|nr:glycosyltransferase family 4 protein [Singulisphaera sp. GP187]